MSMRTYILIITLTFFMLIEQALAEIIETTDLALLEETLSQENQDTLVIFDVDHVLIMPTDDYTMSRNLHRKNFWKDMQERLPEDQIKFLHSIVTSKAKWRLVDPKIIDIINYLREHKIPSIALTSLGTGQLGIIEKREDLRLQELKTVGINFFDLSSFQDTITIPELAGDHGVPMLKEGVILTAEVDKAVVLEHILHSKNHYPKTIIFVDDILSNLESVSRMCSKLNVTFLGFHYTAVSAMEKPASDQETEKLRLQILEKEHIWFTGKDLKRRIISNQMLTDTPL